MATEKRLIDANKILYHQSGFPKGDGFDSGLDWAFREDIDKLPTVDAVEVVRCEECLYYTVEKKRCDHQCLDYDVECYDHWLEMEPTDFCSYGERRTDNA